MCPTLSALALASLALTPVEYAIGEEVHLELPLDAEFSGTSPAGWWVDDVELVRLP